MQNQDSREVLLCSDDACSGFAQTVEGINSATLGAPRTPPGGARKHFQHLRNRPRMAPYRWISVGEAYSNRPRRWGTTRESVMCHHEFVPNCPLWHCFIPGGGGPPGSPSCVIKVFFQIVICWCCLIYSLNRMSEASCLKSPPRTFIDVQPCIRAHESRLQGPRKGFGFDLL